MTLLTALTVASGLAFLGYGVHGLVSEGMREEFRRFGLEPLRLLTGWLEILGGAGLLAGFGWPAVQPLAAGGLCLLMVCGLAVRLRHRDGVQLALPAAVLMLVNGYIMVERLRR
jgi:uncharacterized membrane protein YphA (DoxX/SURF4 family)